MRSILADACDDSVVFALMGACAATFVIDGDFSFLVTSLLLGAAWAIEVANRLGKPRL